MAWPVIAAIGVTVGGAIIGHSQNKKAAKKADEIGNENADDLLAAAGQNSTQILRLAGLHSDATLQNASLNAGATHAIGLANAKAHISSARENIGIVEAETNESLRRQVIRADFTAGAIRGATGASGVRLGNGSALAMLIDARNEAQMERNWIGKQGQMRMNQFAAEGARRAEITMKEAKQRGGVMMRSAAVQAKFIREDAAARAAGTLRDAKLNAASLRRGGSMLSMNYRNQATANIVQGIGQSAMIAANYYS